jgi:N-acyl-D-amino-acid deacylase
VKRFPTRSAVVGLTLTAAAAVVFAQVYPGGYPVNPYTGRAVPGQGSYNPYTGQGRPAAAPNPFTGAPAAPGVNPLTGKPLPGGAPYNPYTGRGQPGGALPPSMAAASAWPDARYPVTGKAGPGLEALDAAVLALMKRHGIPGASLAIAKAGKLVYAKGFGWADLAAGTPADPRTVFSLASLSKPITALAILLLVDQGRLDLDDRVFAILRHIRPPAGARVNPALGKITIRQLLNHSGGWDRAKSGEPTNWGPQIARALRVPLPLTDEQFISFMMTQRLDFEPGTQYHYSNVGYILLGRVVEKVSGQPYEQFVQQRVLGPVGVKNAFLNLGGRASYGPGEAHCYLAGTNVQLPPMNLPLVHAAGGWCAPSVSLVRFLTAVDGSRVRPMLTEKTFLQMLAPPRQPFKGRTDGYYNALGWPKALMRDRAFTYVHDGQYHGMRTFMKRSPQGINWALLFNVSMEPDQIDARALTQAVREVRERVEGIKSYPNVDYFVDYPG